MVLEITEKNDELKNINYIYTAKVQDKPSVVFEHVTDEHGAEKVIRCSEVVIELEKTHETGSENAKSYP